MMESMNEELLDGDFDIGDGTYDLDAEDEDALLEENDPTPSPPPPPVISNSGERHVSDDQEDFIDIKVEDDSFQNDEDHSDDGIVTGRNSLIDDDTDDENERERSRFKTERKISVTPRKSNMIPETLDGLVPIKVTGPFRNNKRNRVPVLSSHKNNRHVRPRVNEPMKFHGSLHEVRIDDPHHPYNQSAHPSSSNIRQPLHNIHLNPHFRPRGPPFNQHNWPLGPQPNFNQQPFYNNQHFNYNQGAPQDGRWNEGGQFYHPRPPPNGPPPYPNFNNQFYNGGFPPEGGPPGGPGQFLFGGHHGGGEGFPPPHRGDGGFPPYRSDVGFHPQHRGDSGFPPPHGVDGVFPPPHRGDSGFPPPHHPLYQPPIQPPLVGGPWNGPPASLPPPQPLFSPNQAPFPRPPQVGQPLNENFQKSSPIKNRLGLKRDHFSPFTKLNKYKRTETTRTLVSCNLQEIQTVDTPPHPPVKVKAALPEDEDEEMKTYRLKIEEQKRKREEIWRQKEQKRMEASLNNKISESGTDEPDPNIPSDQQLKLVRVRTKDGKTVLKRLSLEALQKLKKISPADSTTNTSPEGGGDGSGKATDIKTKTISISNLSASTTQKQLLDMGKKVGVVKSIKLDGLTKSATMSFESTESAAAFCLKFQRKMVDLSMISVTLLDVGRLDAAPSKN